MNPRRWAVALVCMAAVSATVAWAQEGAQLPPPYETPSVKNGPKIVDRPGNAAFHVPPGFHVEEYAAGFARPRFMIVGPSGEILLSDAAEDGAVYVLTDPGHQQRNPERRKLVDHLLKPYGLAFWKDYLYIAETTSIKRYKYDRKAMTVGPGEEVVSMKGFDKGHVTRSLLFDRGGEKLYVGVGSSANVVTGDPETRAAINRYNPDGSGHEIFASGTRNPIGIHWYPGTDTLWAAVQERDLLGDDLAPDYFTHIRKGGFYGWPYAYLGAHEDPTTRGQRPDLVAKTIVPDMLLLPAHLAVLDFTFYTGKQFPAEYRGGAFLAFHGSSNRAQRVGYEIAFAPFSHGRPSGARQDFLTGWMLGAGRPEVWGRPVAVLQMDDGSLLVSDDGGKKLWRIYYQK
ncbi:MAG: PQQ-dependent sugar dehydrogenase [Bryobacteraceae bacterium]